jgi:hypothetical protein
MFRRGAAANHSRTARRFCDHRRGVGGDCAWQNQFASSSAFTDQIVEARQAMTTATTTARRMANR